MYGSKMFPKMFPRLMNEFFKIAFQRIICNSLGLLHKAKSKTHFKEVGSITIATAIINNDNAPS